MKPSAPKSIARGDAVYFIASECKTYVKIGRSNDAMKRLKTLQTSSPLKLVLLGAVHAKPAYEKYLHACFAKNRMHGEWFFNDDRLRHAINVILGQPTLNFPEFEYAPEIGEHSVIDFFGLFASKPKAAPLSPLEEWEQSEEFRELMAVRDRMTDEQLEALIKLETACIAVMQHTNAYGNEQVLRACEATRLAFVLLDRATATPEQITTNAINLLAQPTHPAWAST